MIRSTIRCSTVSLALLALVGCAPPPNTNPSATIQLAPGTAALRVTVENVRTSRGTVTCGLFNAAEGFPGASPIIGGSITATAVAGPMVCAFEALPSGTYAVTVIHDENGNGVLDTSVFGAPTEGYGASNNVLPALSAPTFSDARVSVSDGAATPIGVRLRY